MKNSDPVDADVIVVGGGPAGSTAAAILARRGWRVTLLEKERFPRFQIGESLIPYNNDIFHDLGVWETLSERGFVDKRGAEFVTADGVLRQKFNFAQSLPPRYSRSFQVRRAEFDEILLDTARDRGVNVIEGARVRRVELDEPDACSVSYTSADGTETRLNGRFLIDASGAEGRATASVVHRSDRSDLKKISIFAHYRGVAPAEDGSRDITIALFRDGWFWVIPVDGETTSVGVVLDADEWKRSGATRGETLELAIAGSPYLRGRMSSAERVGEIRARKDFSYLVDRMYGSNFALVGDAAGFIDPIFSTGVFVAMRSSQMAAEAVDHLLREGRLAPLRRYERVMRRVFDRYLRIIESFYRREFIEVFLHPHPRFGLVKVIVGLLAGNGFETAAGRWRMELFYLLVRVQGARGMIAPRIAWDKLPSVRGERVSEVNVV